MKKCTILDEEDKSQLEYIVHQQPVIISSYLIEEEEGEELVGGKRAVEALVVKTEKDPLCNQSINSLFKVNESIHMNGHRWRVCDQGHFHVLLRATTFVRVPPN